MRSHSLIRHLTVSLLSLIIPPSSHINPSSLLTISLPLPHIISSLLVHSTYNHAPPLQPLPPIHPNLPINLPPHRVCLAGVLRLYYSITTDVSHDSTWEGTYLWTWETAELDLGIICASLPSLKKLITRIMPKIFGSTLHSKTASRPTVGYQLGSRPQQQELWPPSRSGVGGSGNAEYILESIVNAKGVGVAHERESQEELTKGHAREGGIIVTRQIDVSSFA